MFANKKVSCIIPAYNEQGRLYNVLSAIHDYPNFDEIIVVDDGSSDGTAEDVKDFPNVTLIQHEVNKGKASAFITGLNASDGELIMMLDADLEGVIHENLNNLLLPHKHGDCMTLSLRSNTPSLYKWTGIAIWSGERVLPRYILEEISYQSDIRYAVESFINDAAIRHKLPIISVDWSNVRYIVKAKKEGLRRGIYLELSMFQNIFEEFPVSKWGHQMIYMPVKSIISKRKIL